MRFMLCLLFPLAIATSGEIDEAALFADTNTVVDSAAVIRSVADAITAETPTVSFSGVVTAAASITANGKWFTDDDTRLHAANTRFNSFTVGEGFVDARMPGGFKAFANLEAQYAADSAVASCAVPELFVDANIRRRVYFRAGKQVLQWGRCYFWNPTDLVNVEKKSFVQKIGSREGTYGLKAHAPFGTVANLYGFAGARGVARADSIAASVKVEALVKGTEVALSMWGKRGSKPVYGFDFSSRILSIDVMGEIGVFQEYQVRRPQVVDGRLATPVDATRKWAPRIALGAGKWFKVQGVPDRLMVNAEFYYNHAGLAVKKLNPAAQVLRLMQQGAAQNVTFDPAQVQAFLASSGLYEPNSYSRLYGALFASFSKFILSDLTLSANGICNFDQQCAMLSGAVNYTMLNNFSLGLLLIGFIGPENTEYTFMGDAMQVRLTGGVTF